MIERKGILPLLTAWIKHSESYPNDNLLVVGDGELYEECKFKYGNVSSIHLEGGVPYDDIYESTLKSVFFKSLTFIRSLTFCSLEFFFVILKSQTTISEYVQKESKDKTIQLVQFSFRTDVRARGSYVRR